MRAIFDTAILIAVITSILFVVSTVWFNGYYHVFNLDADILERSFHQVIYSGFLKLWTVIVPKSAIVIIIVMYGLILISIFSLLIPVLKRKHLRLTTSNTKYHRMIEHLTGLSNLYFPSEREGVLLKRINVIAIKLLSLSLFLIFVTFLLANLETGSRSKAYERLERYRNFEIDKIDTLQADDTLVKIKINGELKTLFQLACGTHHCAGMEVPASSELKIHYFSVSNGFSYVVPESKLKTLKSRFD